MSSKTYFVGENRKMPFTFMTVHPSVPTISGLETPVLENTAVTLACTVDRVKPNTAIVKWRIRGTDYPGETTSEETSEPGVYKLVNTYTHTFQREDNGQHVTCVVTPQEGMGNPNGNTATITVYCRLWF